MAGLLRQCRATCIIMAWEGTHTRDEDPFWRLALGLELCDESVGVCVGQVETGASTPVSEKSRLDVVLVEIARHERILAEEDLGSGTGCQLVDYECLQVVGSALESEQALNVDSTIARLERVDL